VGTGFDHKTRCGVAQAVEREPVEPGASDRRQPHPVTERRAAERAALRGLLGEALLFANARVEDARGTQPPEPTTPSLPPKRPSAAAGGMGYPDPESRPDARRPEQLSVTRLVGGYQLGLELAGVAQGFKPRQSEQWHPVVVLPI
jgi:hypothetical protein